MANAGNKPIVLKPIGEPSEYCIIKEAVLKVGRYQKELRVIAYEIKNTLSDFIEISVAVLCPKSIKSKDLLGKTGTFKLNYDNIKLSYAGYVEVVESQMPCSSDKEISTKNVTKTIYLYDKLFKLKHNVRSKTYKQGGPKEIITELFKDYGLNYDIKLRANDRKIVCQYNEDDYTFFCRICDYYSIGYYYNQANSKYVIHDSPNYDKKIDLKNDVEFILQESSTNSKVIYTSRLKWNTNMVTQAYAAKTINATKSYFLESGFTDSGVLKTMSQHRAMTESKANYVYNDIFMSLYAGSMLNGKVVKEFYLSQSYSESMRSRVVCIDGGLVVPKFIDNRGPVISAGFTQADASKVNNNQSIMNKDLFEIPVKMLFDAKALIFARQSYLWLGSFYGTNFPIREQTEVLVLFTDSLMSSAYIVSCYSNKSNSAIMNNEEVGIKTASFKTTSSEKDMNTLIFSDAKDKEVVKLTGKKDMLIQSKCNIKIISEETINSETKNVITKTKENVNIEAEKDIMMKSKKLVMDVETQETKTSKDYKIDAKQELELLSQKVVIGDTQVEIKAKKLTIDADQLLINSKAGEFNFKGNLKSDIGMWDLTVKSLKTEISMLQMKSKLSIVQMEMVKLESKMILLEAKIFMIMAKLVNIGSSLVMIGPG